MNATTNELPATARSHTKAVARRNRARKWMRKLPTKHNVERYPILKYWGKSAKKRAYLWSWRRPQTTRALYVGWIITMMPLGGFQIALAALFSVLFKANLTIASALQFVSNPLTAAPIYVATYFTGKLSLGYLGVLPTQIISKTALSLLLGGLIVGSFCALASDALFWVWIKTRRGAK